ncbi:uncharacterized protein [Clytia hemisphaerica]|uniref:Cnidarian restricted protein n=1 Tax=Clytia hemisphaerica TaxID=252671 RepID=A0A7M5X3C7_9CNID
MKPFKTILVLIYVYTILPGIKGGDQPIKVANFDPQPGKCKSTYEAFAKYFENAKEEEEEQKKKGSERLNEEITKDIDNFVKENGESSISENLRNYVGKTGGEFTSWVTAIVTASYAVAGVMATTGKALSIVSPGVGLLSWIFGAYSTYKDVKAKKKFVQSIQRNFRALNNKMDLQYDELKEYVDESIIDVDHQRLIGVLSQMNLELSDCLLISDVGKREDCLSSRCSSVKAGFKEFALFSDILSGSLVVSDEEEHVPDQTLRRMNGQRIKRLFANLPIFKSYVATVLLRCEAYRVVKKHMNVAGDGKVVSDTADIFDVLSPNENEWNVEEAVLTYLKNSIVVIHDSQKTVDKDILLGYGWVKDGSKPKKGKIFKKYPTKIQCRFKMNAHFNDICDREYEINDQTSFTDKEVEQFCRAMSYTEKISFDQSIDPVKFSDFAKFDQIKEMMTTLYKGPGKEDEPKPVEQAEVLMEEQKEKPKEDQTEKPKEDQAEKLKEKQPEKTKDEPKKVKKDEQVSVELETRNGMEPNDVGSGEQETGAEISPTNNPDQRNRIRTIVKRWKN